MGELTHINGEGRARMADVGGKEATRRTAAAAGRIFVSEETLELIRTGGHKKGDVLCVAQVAGIMAAKQTALLIPMCHSVQLCGIDLSFRLNDQESCVEIRAEASCVGNTGVEMEALTAVSAAALTIYDMCKSVQRDMVIGQIRLLAKSGGKSGNFTGR